jgi:hypothetical protein
VLVHRAKQDEEETANARLIDLVATALQRFFEKQTPQAVDFGRDQSVTTTCPDGGVGEDGST